VSCLFPYKTKLALARKLSCWSLVKLLRTCSSGTRDAIRQRKPTHTQHGFQTFAGCSRSLAGACHKREVNIINF
jgi:hypothetical protein